jgi:hypothetical protein
MPKFAVYYVPQADDPFYRLGTSVLGYDVRARTSVALPSDLREVFGSFDDGWTVLSRPYGFHLTITEAIECSWATIPQVERELSDLLGCFDPAHPFVLSRRGERPVGIWGETGRNSLVLLFEPNEYVRMLHTLLVARINPLGKGSSFLERYLAHSGQELQPHLAQQIRLFYSPTVLDNWYPHFTLLNPYTGGEPARAWPHSSRNCSSRTRNSSYRRFACSSRWMTKITGTFTRSFAVDRRLPLQHSRMISSRWHMRDVLEAKGYAEKGEKVS